MRLHSLDSLAAAVLALEIVHGHALDISEIRHGNYSVHHPGSDLPWTYHTRQSRCFVRLSSPYFSRDHEDLFSDHT